MTHTTSTNEGGEKLQESGHYAEERARATDPRLQAILDQARRYGEETGKLLNAYDRERAAEAADPKRRVLRTIDRALAAEERAAGQHRRIEILVAPNCEPDILANVPRVTTGEDGDVYLTLSSAAGDDGPTRYRVRELARLYRFGLVLLATGKQAFLMSADDYDHTAPKRTREELQQSDLTDDAEAMLVGTLAGVDDNDLSPAARTLWDASSEVLEGADRYTARERFGYVLALDALIASPEAVQRALRSLRAQLVRCDPALALVDQEAPHRQ